MDKDADTGRRPRARAKSITELISSEALAGERLGRLTDPVARAMLDANLFSMLLPAADGGDDCSRVEFFKTVEEVARADGSAGWCLSVCSAIADFTYRAASRLAVDEVFGAGPVAIWTSLLPRATSRSIEGGFEVNGAFSMGSGSASARWVVIPAPLEDREGVQWFRGHIIPKDRVSIQPDTWNVMGLKATTSIEYTIDEVFVPAHRTFEYPFVGAPAPGVVSALYGIRLNQIGLTAFACGVAERALDELIDSAQQTKRTAGAGLVADDSVVQFGIGELEGRFAAARSSFLHLVERQDSELAAQGFINPILAERTSIAAQIVARAARDLTIFAFDYAGTTVIFDANPIQRCLRDIFAGLKHAAFTPNFLTRAGMGRLGRSAPPARLR